MASCSDSSSCCSCCSCCLLASKHNGFLKILDSYWILLSLFQWFIAYYSSIYRSTIDSLNCCIFRERHHLIERSPWPPAHSRWTRGGRMLHNNTTRTCQAGKPPKILVLRRILVEARLRKRAEAVISLPMPAYPIPILRTPVRVVLSCRQRPAVVMRDQMWPVPSHRSLHKPTRCPQQQARLTANNQTYLDRSLQTPTGRNLSPRQ